MAGWLPFKAIAKDRNQNWKKATVFTRNCSICGKPIRGGGDLCGGCEKFIKRKSIEERKRKNDNR